MSALGQLPPDYRLPVVLRDLYGLEYKEIARVLDRPWVRSRPTCIAAAAR